VTPSLFAAEPIDRVALAELARRSLPRDELNGRYCNLVKSSDLIELGYSVSHWVIPGTPRSEVLEFNPRVVAGVPADLPRVTVDNYADQAALHEAIGARVLPPGRDFWPKRPR
jgi:hypothetical protein